MNIKQGAELEHIEMLNGISLPGAGSSRSIDSRNRYTYRTKVTLHQIGALLEWEEDTVQRSVLIPFSNIIWMRAAPEKKE